MKSDIELLEINGLKTPNLSEPAGDLFKAQMLEAKVKIEKKRVIERDEANKRNKLKEDLRQANNRYLMAEDEHEEQEAKRQAQEIQEKLETLPDFSRFDIKAFAQKVINNPEILKSKSLAHEEHMVKREEIEAYSNELTKRYNEAMREVNRFMAGLRSDSSYREGAVLFNKYKNY